MSSTFLIVNCHITSVTFLNTLSPIMTREFISDRGGKTKHEKLACYYFYNLQYRAQHGGHGSKHPINFHHMDFDY